MEKDPFYREIIVGLSGRLDAATFEACAVDVLRRDYPALVPVRGGSDAGFDGEISDLLGPPVPLICTTGKDTSSNLRKNMASLRENGHQGNRAIFVTSQSLTPQARRKLSLVASEYGFEHLAILDQSAVSTRLYERPAWCKELLGLTGVPSALSISPVTRRPLLSSVLVGKDSSWKWIRSTSGDKLLIGQPGSGKTALLHQLAREGEGLFVVATEREHLANAIRVERPKALFVDDAHLFADILTQLHQLRVQVQAEFDIIASCWVGHELYLRDALRIPASQCHELTQLDRDQMVEVIRGVGLDGPNELVAEIVTQAAGRPGLAVTLAQACLDGDIREVIQGDALSRNVARMMSATSWDEDSRMLGVFALGGDGGLPTRAVAPLIGLSPIALASRLATMGHAGIVRVVPNRDGIERVAVEPASLRAALVRDTFFVSPTVFDLAEAMELVQDNRHLAQTLVEAQACGANVENEFLMQLLDSVASPKAWQTFAWNNPRQCARILHERPHLILKVAKPALAHCPQQAIPMLLDLATSDNRDVARNPDHPLREINDWIREADPRYERGLSPVARRRMLLQSATNWIERGGDELIGLKALAMVLDPEFWLSTLDPGLGHTVTMIRGTLPDTDLAEISDLWPLVRDSIANARRVPWTEVFDSIGDWAFPTRWQQNPLPSTSKEFMKSQASVMLRDLASIVTFKGVAVRARDLAKRAGISLDVDVCPIFDALYGIDDDDDLYEFPELGSLAARWKDEDPNQVAQEMVKLEQDARASGISYPRRMGELAARMSSNITKQLPWVCALVKHELAADIVHPFLRNSCQTNEAGWELALSEALASPRYEAAAIDVALTLQDAPDRIIELAMARAQNHTEWIYVLAMRRAISLPVVQKLLVHEDDEVAGAVAHGEWLASKNSGQRKELLGQMRAAFLRDPDQSHQAIILKAHPELAFDWLMLRIRQPDRTFILDDRDPAAIAARALGPEQRIALIDALQEPHPFPEFIARLVGRDPVVYAHLLSVEHLGHVHYAPLMGSLDSSWIKLAHIALRSGLPPSVVAVATLQQFGVFSGSHSSVLQERLEQLEAFAASLDSELASVLAIAIEMEQGALERQLARERQEAVFGYRR